MRTVAERLKDYEGEIKIFENPSYDGAFVGVTEDNCAVYSYEKMIEWLCETENWSDEEAIEFIDYNTIRALPYFGPEAPIIVYEVEE